MYTGCTFRMWHDKVLNTLFIYTVIHYGMFYGENKVKPLSVSFHFGEEVIYFRRERVFCLLNFDDDVETLIICMVDN